MPQQFSAKIYKLGINPCVDVPKHSSLDLGKRGSSSQGNTQWPFHPCNTCTQRGWTTSYIYKRRNAEISSLPVPTTVLHGAQDGATLPQASAGREAFFSGPYARHVIAGVGHFIQRERPEVVVEAVLQLARRAQKGR
ncbi:MAG: alpha/beta hydrolase [Anaerolineales bacterium]|nr:alpha/beta hydrolase [Anaerolineales bacterium]